MIAFNEGFGARYETNAISNANYPLLKHVLHWVPRTVTKHWRLRETLTPAARIYFKQTSKDVFRIGWSLRLAEVRTVRKTSVVCRGDFVFSPSNVCSLWIVGKHFETIGTLFELFVESCPLSKKCQHSELFIQQWSSVIEPRSLFLFCFFLFWGWSVEGSIGVVRGPVRR